MTRLETHQITGPEGGFNMSRLEQITGIHRRRIRYWRSLELVDPPHGKKSGSHYNLRHVEQIRHVVSCLARGEKVSQIKAADRQAALNANWALGLLDPQGNAVPYGNLMRCISITPSLVIWVPFRLTSLEHKAVEQMRRVAERILGRAIDAPKARRRSEKRAKADS